MTVDEVKIKNEFANEIEKPKKEKERLTWNVLGIEWKSLRKNEIWVVKNLKKIG